MQPLNGPPVWQNPGVSGQPPPPPPISAAVAVIVAVFAVAGASDGILTKRSTFMVSAVSPDSKLEQTSCVVVLTSEKSNVKFREAEIAHEFVSLFASFHWNFGLVP